MTKQPTSHQAPFGKSLEELEAITAWFESEGVDLDEGVEKFERGLALISQLRSQLATVENRVEKIRADFVLPTTVEPVADEEPPPTAREPEALADSPALFDI